MKVSKSLSNVISKVYSHKSVLIYISSCCAEFQPVAERRCYIEKTEKCFVQFTVHTYTPEIRNQKASWTLVTVKFNCRSFCALLPNLITMRPTSCSVCLLELAECALEAGQCCTFGQLSLYSNQVCSPCTCSDASTRPRPESCEPPQPIPHSWTCCAHVCLLTLW